MDGNKRYGFSADDTLKHVQSLYEKKLVTYPRVDTTYLSEDLHPKIPNTLRGLKDYERFTAQVLSGIIGRKAYVGGFVSLLSKPEA